MSDSLERIATAVELVAKATETATEAALSMTKMQKETFERMEASIPGPTTSELPVDLGAELERADDEFGRPYAQTYPSSCSHGASAALTLLDADMLTQATGILRTKVLSAKTARELQELSAAGAALQAEVERRARQALMPPGAESH